MNTALCTSGWRKYSMEYMHGRVIRAVSPSGHGHLGALTSPHWILVLGSRLGRTRTEPSCDDTKAASQSGDVRSELEPGRCEARGAASPPEGQNLCPKERWHRIKFEGSTVPCVNKYYVVMYVLWDMPLLKVTFIMKNPVPLVTVEDNEVFKNSSNDFDFTWYLHRRRLHGIRYRKFRVVR